MNKTQTPIPVSRVSDCDPRVQLATERTLLAWVRTGLALMAFGFMVARFGLILQSLGIKTDSLTTLFASAIGIFMVLLGSIANAGASVHYRNYFRNLIGDNKDPFTAWSLAIWVAIASAAIGVLLIIYLLIVDIASWNASASAGLQNQILPNRQ